MELEVEVYRSENGQMVVNVQGAASGEIRFPDLTAFEAFIIDCQELLDHFYGSAIIGDMMPEIPEAILMAFDE
jgi:hypothetical protein